MKKTYLYLILFLTFNWGFCQEATLRILGNSRYSEIAEKKAILLNFEFNSEICNPITQDKTIEVQVDEFNQNLKSEKMEYKLIHKETLNINPENSKSYELVVSLDCNENKIQKIINSSGIKRGKTYYKFSDTSFLDEDKKAILAFKNTQSKAKELAKILNYEILEVVSIDDDTSDANDVFELLGMDDLDDERKEMMYSIFEKLNDLEVNSNPTKEGAYNLWVTYKIRIL
ncbi:hypothetical protein [Flavobacterium sp.]|jgi:hypothetical protein|uniref:hypothetical protein n=1 Tax=Flavobacterium sp. TaxID=239 RepID=UPI0037C0AE93